MGSRISPATMRQAEAFCVAECWQHAEIRTVTLTTDGASGDVRVRIEGFAYAADARRGRSPYEYGEPDLSQPYDRSFTIAY